jgi:hypothetical protein
VINRTPVVRSTCLVLINVNDVLIVSDISHDYIANHIIAFNCRIDTRYNGYLYCEIDILWSPHSQHTNNSYPLYTVCAGEDTYTYISIDIQTEKYNLSANICRMFGGEVEYCRRHLIHIHVAGGIR